jgi:hypothetical protein
VDDLQQRAARGVALAALAVACVVVGPAPRLTQALERTFAVAVVDAQRERRRRHSRIPRASWRRRTAPRPARPGSSRP